MSQKRILHDLDHLIAQGVSEYVNLRNLEPGTRLQIWTLPPKLGRQDPYHIHILRNEGRRALLIEVQIDPFIKEPRVMEYVGAQPYGSHAITTLPIIAPWHRMIITDPNPEIDYGIVSAPVTSVSSKPPKTNIIGFRNWNRL